MPVRTRHPRLAKAACAVYRMALWLYPTDFRRTFGRELAVTFRNRVEDVLDGGGMRTWLAFAAHIAWDTVRASFTMMAAGAPPGSASLLGLSDGDVARGGIASDGVDVHLLFAAAGLVVAVGGWYAYFAVLPAYVS
jgi:hypothetical protein